MLKTKEVKDYVKRELEPHFVEQGFTSKTEKEFVFSYSCDNEGTSHELFGYLLKYNDYKLVYGFSFGLQKVVEVLKQIDKHTPLERRKYSIGNTLISISPGSILFPREPERPYKDFDNEFRLKLILFDIQAFYQSYYLPFCNKYSDIKQLNKLYNRLDDFRIDAWEFPNLGFFHVTRLVIARLANDPNFDEIVNKNFEALEQLWQRDGGVYDRLDESKPEVFAAKYLKDNSFE
jgi:hypothetical protein